MRRGKQKRMDVLKSCMRIEGKECVRIKETDSIYSDELKIYFSIFPERLVFVVNEQEQVTAIVPGVNFVDGLNDETCMVIKTFTHIVFEPGYLNAVDTFFNNTLYNWIPILDKEGRLVEYFLRNKFYNSENIVVHSKWLNITIDYLAKQIQKKGYRKIKILEERASKTVYRYFKHYASLFKTVEIIPYKIIRSGGEVKCDKTEVLITIAPPKLLLELNVDVVSIWDLCTELEYCLFLDMCMKNGVRTYIITHPTRQNVWNLTD